MEGVQLTAAQRPHDPRPDRSSTSPHAVARRWARRQAFVPPAVGRLAGLTLIFVGLGGLGGVLWGWLQPRYDAILRPGQQPEISGNPAFYSFGTAVLAVAFVGAVGAVVAFFAIGRRLRGMAAAAWLGLAATVVFFVVGRVCAQGFDVTTGEHLRLSTTVHPGVGWLAGVYAAVVVFWSFLVADSASGSEDR